LFAWGQTGSGAGLAKIDSLVLMDSLDGEGAEA
jgi:hypothetical protein